jgi:acyl carrier protein phosphodiesterase
MNFLAHIYLSGDDPQMRIGNFMADGVRGQNYEQYPPGIKNGILLHRAIDSFTDAHPVFRQSTKRLHPDFHHYSGVIVDVFYDHFLAANWKMYSADNLEDYAQSFYQLLESNHDILTDRVAHILPVMKTYNWLGSYASVDGISQILQQMDRRTDNQSKMRFAGDFLRRDYKLYEKEFFEFFPDLESMCREKRAQLGATPD